ncbi:hypothetical protein VP199E371_P0036 [Vibrio phage 199E37-1]|nr:hypothetical protein VP199E371_P0036 [Vibrio phage 199E37-1]
MLTRPDRSYPNPFLLPFTYHFKSTFLQVGITITVAVYRINPLPLNLSKRDSESC